MRTWTRAILTALLTAAVTLPAHTAAQAPATSPADVSPPSTRPFVQALASERLGGREAGSADERAAGDYLASQLTRLGAKPLPGRKDMFQPFTFTAGSRDGGSRAAVTTGSTPAKVFSTAKDVQALSFSDDAEITGAVVFAGYGIVVPESQGFGYDSFATLDVKDKIVVVLRYFPEDADQKTRGILARYSDLRYKAMAARQRGAKGLVVVTGPRSPNAGTTVPMAFDSAIAGSGIAAVSVSRDVDTALFAGGKPLADAQKDLDTGNPHVAGFALPGVEMTIAAKVTRERRTARNVVAYLPATAPVAAVEKPWVAVGAHYDHLGRNAHSGSLASREDGGRAHLGADDNASGTAAVLAIAGALARQPMRKRHLLIGLWSAEEIGLLGSAAFVGTPPVPADQLAAYLNFDMVGRMQDNKLVVQATGTSAAWGPILERVNVAAGFDLTVQPDPSQPTDVSSFNQAGVPSLSFTTGAHADYHKPSDTADKIDYDDLDRVAAMATALARRVMEADAPPQFTKVEQSAQTVSRTGVRIFTGTVPDYASAVKGLLLGGVVGGGPAEQAGLQKGDVIVEIAGQAITNIYDYTYALDLLKIGQPAKVVYLRGTERRETMLTPAARR
jgi:hypothetical protein